MTDTPKNSYGPNHGRPHRRISTHADNAQKARARRLERIRAAAAEELAADDARARRKGLY
jgi:hypothetical protein